MKELKPSPQAHNLIESDTTKELLITTPIPRAEFPSFYNQEKVESLLQK